MADEVTQTPGAKTRTIPMVHTKTRTIPMVHTMAGTIPMVQPVDHVREGTGG